jgi:hypothetical protein
MGADDEMSRSDELPPTVDADFGDRLWVVRQRILAFEATFFVAGAVGLAACWYASRIHGDPGAVIYLFPISFAIVLGTFPTLTYLLNRWIKQFDIARCASCNAFLWPNTLIAIQVANLGRCPRCWRRLPGRRLNRDHG